MSDGQVQLADFVLVEKSFSFSSITGLQSVEHHLLQVETHIVEVVAGCSNVIIIGYDFRELGDGRHVSNGTIDLQGGVVVRGDVVQLNLEQLFVQLFLEVGGGLRHSPLLAFVNGNHLPLNLQQEARYQ